MKKHLLTALLISFITSLSAQSPHITLPTYAAGKYECDTFFTSFNTIPTAWGSVYKTNFDFVSGMKFLMVIDSVVGLGPSLATWDSAGHSVPLIKGAQIELPVRFHAYKLGFHLIIAGTPTTASEVYACDLWHYCTLGEDFGMIISPFTDKTCMVDPAQEISELKAVEQTFVYPNPASNNIRIEGVSSYKPYVIYDASGRAVVSGMITSTDCEVDIHCLVPGNYLIQIGSEQQTLKFVKK
jgi:hypothetical protein